MTLPRAALVLSLVCLAAGPSFAGTPEEESNKRVVVEFSEKGLNQKDFDAAAPYLGTRYVQHNPTAADGIEGFRRFLGFLKETFPASRGEIKRVLAEGDIVVLHVHAVREPGTRGNAIVDMFRLENGKIVEHWDVIQPIPENAANPNTMF